MLFNQTACILTLFSHDLKTNFTFRAYKYYKKYTQDVKFDNIYITSYFKKIDARRKHKVSKPF